MAALTRKAERGFLLAGLGLLALFLLLAIVAWLSGRRMERDSLLISTDAVPGSIAAHAMRGALADGMHLSALAALAPTDSARRAGLDAARRSDEAFRNALQRYRGTIRINRELDNLLTDSLVAALDDLARHRTEFAPLVSSPNVEARFASWQDHLIPSYQAVNHAADALVAYNHANATRLAQAIAGSIRQLRFTILVVVILALGCAWILVNDFRIRKREEDAIRASEVRLRGIIDSLPVFVGLVDLEGNLVDVNHAALQAAGISHDEAVGRPFHETPWWAESPEEQLRLKRALKEASNGALVRYDVRNRVAGGKIVNVDFCAGPLRDRSGQVRQVVVAGVDITERRQLQDQFVRAQRIDAIGTLASGLAHDLNNILAPILMAAGLMRTAKAGEGQSNLVSLIEGGAKRGAGIIRQLLTFSRGVESTRVSISLGHIIKDVANMARETFPRNITQAQEVARDLRPVMGDPTQLHQVLLNLCVNARDAMPRGGKLSLQARNVIMGDAEAAALPGARGGEWVRVSVADTGEGIPADLLERIFEAFFTTKPVGKGTGLGLSSVRAIVELHGGFVTVQSTLQVGTTFSVYLPPAEVGEELAAEGGPEVRGSGELVLVVDDEPAMRAMTKETLEAHGFRAITATNGEDALRLFEEHRSAVRAVVTDLDMPVMDGVALIRALGDLAPALRIVVMSGSDSESRAGELMSMGPVELLAKPCDPGTLLRAVKAAVE